MREITPDGPTIIIGERINPTGRRKLGESLIADDIEAVRRDALSQVQASAQILDVNMGYPGVDGPKMIVESIRVVVVTVDVPFCLDSANPAVMAAGLSAYKGKMILSSVTA